MPGLSADARVSHKGLSAQEAGAAAAHLEERNEKAMCPTLEFGPEDRRADLRPRLLFQWSNLGRGPQKSAALDFSQWKRRDREGLPLASLARPRQGSASSPRSPAGAGARVQRQPPPRGGSTACRRDAEPAVRAPLLAAAGGGRRAAPSLIGRGAGAAMLAEAVPPVPWRLAVAVAAASVGAVSCFFASPVSRR